MNEKLENIIKNATDEQLKKLMLIAEAIVQRDSKTVPSAHQT